GGEPLLRGVALLLVLRQLLLQRLRLLLWAGELAARLRGRAEADRHGQRPVVADAEPCRDEVVRLALGRRLRRGADVLLAEVQGQEGDGERDEDYEHGPDRKPGVARDASRPRSPEST